MASVALSLGVGLASAFLQAALTPPQEGPRLDDLTWPKSEWGQQIPVVWGRMRLTGNIIWATPLQEKKKITKGKGSRGGKGGATGGFGKSTNYSYTANLAFLLCQGPIGGIARIWINRELKYDVTPAASAQTLQASNTWANDYLTIRLGTSNQQKISVIESRMGAARTPAYRDRALLVLGDYPAEGNITAEAEIYSSATLINNRLTIATVYLSQILTDLSKAAGFKDAEIDISELTGVKVDGFFIQSPSPIRDSISQLMLAYFFDAVETGTKIKFQLKTRPILSGITIPYDHLGARQYSDQPRQRFQDKILDSAQLPNILSLNFINPENNYERDIVRAFKANAPNSEEKSLNLNLVLPTNYAQVVADRFLLETWQGRRSVTTTLGPRYLGIEPGDLINLDLYGLGTEILQVRTVTTGANYLVDLEMQPYPGAFPIPGGEGGEGRHFDIELPGPVALEILDIPLIRDTDPDFEILIAARGERFNGADLYISRDGGVSYAISRRLFAETTSGVTLTALPPFLGALTEDDLISTVDVQIYEGDLESISQERFLAGDNLFVIGKEILWARYCELISPMTYRISHLRRGRRGTERYRANHVPNERFVVLSGYLSRLQLQPSDYGKTLHFKAIAEGQSLDEVLPVSLNYAAITQRPYSPQQISAVKLSNGDIQITWQRRDRRTGERSDYAALPNSESYEYYQLNFYNAGLLVRTLYAYQQSFVYSTEFQAADYGALLGTFTVEISQQSPLVGFGTPGSATFNL